MTGPPSISTLRLTGRLSVAFVLDLIRVGRAGREFIDSLIVLGIIQSNIGPLTRDPGLQRAYGSYEAVPPDELRRPVSISGLASSLRLPYETVRRRVAALVAEGTCETTPSGVYVSGAVLQNPAHREVVLATVDLIRRFYGRLRDLGGLEDLPAPDAAEPPLEADAPVRAIVRVSSDYVLRIVDLLSQHIGDLTRGVIFLDVLTANTEGLPDHECGDDDGLDAASFVPDHRRKPVRVATLSARLGIPEETVRRQAANLVTDGLCVRRPDGLLVPAATLARPRALGLMADNSAYVGRMFAGLARLGVTAAWERERIAARKTHQA